MTILRLDDLFSIPLNSAVVLVRNVTLVSRTPVDRAPPFIID
jgi:hypothetical protein